MHHKGYKVEEVILERQKDSDNQRLSQERGRSNYGKASIRNVRATGMGGNAADPAERLVAIDKRHKEHKEKRGVKTKGMKEAYSANPAQQAAIAIAKKKKKEDAMVARKKKQKMYAGYEPEGELVDENIAARLGARALTNIARGSGIINKDGTLNPNPPKSLTSRVTDFGKKLVSGKPGDGYIGDPSLNIKNPIPIIKQQIKKNPAGFTIQNMTSGHEPEGETISEVKDKKGKGSGTKDACYHKVKSRYSVWPSAYASGALVKCRKVGAANWGNSSKKEEFSDWKSEFIWEDGDSSKKIEEDWQKTNRQDKTDGMSQKAVNAYKRENPGSKLKTAVTKKPSSLKRGSKDAKRRKSFCSRMKGMKKRLTSAKTARDPNSRINKALRRWNC